MSKKHFENEHTSKHGGTYMYALIINVVFLADRRFGKGGVRHDANDLQASASDNFEEKSRRRWG